MSRQYLTAEDQIHEVYSKGMAPEKKLDYHLLTLSWGINATWISLNADKFSARAAITFINYLLTSKIWFEQTMNFVVDDQLPGLSDKLLCETSYTLLCWNFEHKKFETIKKSRHEL